MTEYIERNVFIESQRHLYCENCARRKGMKNGKKMFVYNIGDAPCRACDIADVLDAVEDFPAADVRPVVRGKWNWENNPSYSPFDGSSEYIYRCNQCGVYNDRDSAFCPNCGADMREGRQ